MRKPLFLDRDGVLNVDITPYVTHLKFLKLFPWTVESLVALDRAGYDLFIYSNQQGVATGLIPPEQLVAIEAYIQDQLKPHGFQIKKFYHCTARDSENHPWRKPAPGMILAARDEFGLDLTGTFAIGDKWSDIAAAKAAGCRPLLVLSGVTRADQWQSWEVQPEEVFPTLKEATEWVISSSLNP